MKLTHLGDTQLDTPAELLAAAHAELDRAGTFFLISFRADGVRTMVLPSADKSHFWQAVQAIVNRYRGE